MLLLVDPLFVSACSEVLVSSVEAVWVASVFVSASTFVFGSPPAIAQLIIARLAPATIKLVRVNIPRTPQTQNRPGYHILLHPTSAIGLVCSARSHWTVSFATRKSSTTLCPISAERSSNVSTSCAQAYKLVFLFKIFPFYVKQETFRKSF